MVIVHMKNIKNYITSLAAALLLAGCAGSGKKPEKLPDKPLAELCAAAESKLLHGNVSGAAKMFEQIDSHYPYGPHSAAVQMYLAYAHYKNSEWQLAKHVISRFAKLHSTHANIDYILYLQALTSMAQDLDQMHTMFRVDRATRDVQYMQQAFQEFKFFVANYPDSQYAADAWNRLTYIKDYLARHQLAIIEHYRKRNAYVAIINRTTQLLEEFPDTRSARLALPIVSEAYRKLKLEESARKVDQLIALNPVEKR